jgi:hypothetical protein
MKSNKVVESSAGKQRQSGVCMRRDLVGDAVGVAGESGSSARRRVWFWGCMIVGKLCASLWMSGCRLARTAMVAALAG